MLKILQNNLKLFTDLTHSVFLALVHKNIQAVVLGLVPFIHVVADVVEVQKWLLAIRTHLCARITFLLGRGTRVGDREEGQSKADCGVDILESSDSLGSSSDERSTSEGEETGQSSLLVVTTGTSMLKPFRASGAPDEPRELFFLLRKFARRS